MMRVRPHSNQPRLSPALALAAILSCLTLPTLAIAQQTGGEQSGSQSQQKKTTHHQGDPEKGISAGSTTTTLPDEQASNINSSTDPRYGLLTPLPETGGIPAIYNEMYGPSDAELNHRARQREYRTQLRIIERKYFRSRVPETRALGIVELQEFTDPAAFKPLIEEFNDQEDDVRLAILDHFKQQGEQGQAALAWVAIYDKDPAIRNEAAMRMDKQPAQPVLKVLDRGLRSNVHEVANAAGALAGTLNALDTIPLLIAGQATADDRPENEGDLAWIAIQTQTAYIQGLRAVAGNNSGAFEPIVGILNEGTVMRVMDAVVVVYRTEVNRSLVNLTSNDWGQSTEHLGYNINDWWNWYNNTYVPYKNQQHQLQQAREQAGMTGPLTGSNAGSIKIDTSNDK